MTTHTVALALILFTTVFGHAADLKTHIAARPTQYSCDQTMTSGDGEAEMHLVVDGGLRRVEMRRGTQYVVLIMRPDQQRSLTVMPDKKRILVMPYDGKRAEGGVRRGAGR